MPASDLIFSLDKAENLKCNKSWYSHCMAVTYSPHCSSHTMRHFVPHLYAHARDSRWITWSPVRDGSLSSRHNEPRLDDVSVDSSPSNPSTWFAGSLVDVGLDLIRASFASRRHKTERSINRAAGRPRSQQQMRPTTTTRRRSTSPCRGLTPQRRPRWATVRWTFRRYSAMSLYRPTDRYKVDLWKWYWPRFINQCYCPTEWTTVLAHVDNALQRNQRLW